MGERFLQPLLGHLLTWKCVRLPGRLLSSVPWAPSQRPLERQEPVPDLHPGLGCSVEVRQQPLWGDWPVVHLEACVEIECSGAQYLQVYQHTRVSVSGLALALRSHRSSQCEPGSLCALTSCAERALSTTLISPCPPKQAVQFSPADHALNSALAMFGQFCHGLCCGLLCAMMDFMVSWTHSSCRRNSSQCGFIRSVLRQMPT